MSANTSTAVMNRRAEAHDSLDDFPTPPWATRALCEWIKDQGLAGPLSAVQEPAANRGHMARVLGEYFHEVRASDIHDYGAGYPVRDYLFGPVPERVHWVITNPPFRLAEQFITRARGHAVNVAMILRLNVIEGVGRYERLYSVDPPSDVLQFTERVVMHKGKLSAKGSTATAYAWLVWRGEMGRHDGTSLRWIAPCRKRLERAGDYPEAVAGMPAEGDLL